MTLDININEIQEKTENYEQVSLEGWYICTICWFPSNLQVNKRNWNYLQVWKDDTSVQSVGFLQIYKKNKTNLNYLQEKQEKLKLWNWNYLQVWKDDTSVQSLGFFQIFSKTS